MNITLSLLVGMILLCTPQRAQRECTVTLPAQRSDGSITQASSPSYCQQEIVRELSHDLASNQEIASFSVTSGVWSIGQSGSPDQPELGISEGAQPRVFHDVAFNGQFRNAPLVMTRTVSLSADGVCTSSRQLKIDITSEGFQHVIELAGPCSIKSVEAEWIAFEVLPRESVETLDPRWLRGPVEELMNQRRAD